MVRYVSCALGIALMLSVVPARADCLQDKRPSGSEQPQPPRPKFWQDPKLRQEFSITDAQSAQIETIFSSSIQALRDARKDLDGLEAVRWIRNKPELRRLPVYIFSSSALPTDVEQALSAGADDYIVKPIGLDDLRQQLMRLLSRLGITFMASQTARVTSF